MNDSVTVPGPNDLPNVLIALMKNILERESAPALWQGLLAHQARVRDHVGVIGLDLVLDEAEGHAYLRQKPQVEGEPELARLVTRRQLGFSLSLILALLRKKLAEHDAMSGEVRLVVSKADILDMVRLFLPATGNEARLKDRVDRDIGRVVLFLGADFRIHHVGTLEELGLGRTRHQAGDRDPAVLQLVA